MSCTPLYSRVFLLSGRGAAIVPRSLSRCRIACLKFGLSQRRFFAASCYFTMERAASIAATLHNCGSVLDTGGPSPSARTKANAPREYAGKMTAVDEATTLSDKIHRHVSIPQHGLGSLYARLEEVGIGCQAGGRTKCS
jgi:hypothetical protein